MLKLTAPLVAEHAVQTKTGITKLYLNLQETNTTYRLLEYEVYVDRKLQAGKFQQLRKSASYSLEAPINKILANERIVVLACDLCQTVKGKGLIRIYDTNDFQLKSELFGGQPAIQ